MLEAFLPLHPRVVHFPVALSLVGVAFLAAGVLRQVERWRGYGRVSLFLGWLGALAAIATGLVDQSRAPDSFEVIKVINQHITAGIGLVIFQGLALYWPIKNKRLWEERASRWGYLALLLGVVTLVAIEGWLGGKLVYQLRVGVR